MKKIIQIEFLKISRSWMFWAFMALYLCLVVLLESFNGGKGSGAMYQYPGIWTNLLYSVSYLNFFLGLIYIISITSEYQYRTIRQHIVDGLSRWQFFLSKFFYALLLALVVCIFVFLSVLVLAVIHNGTASFSQVFQNSRIIVDLFVQMIGYLSLAMFFGFLFRNTALAAILYMIYVMVLEALVGWITFHSETNHHFMAWLPKTLFSSVVEPIEAMKLLGTPFIGIVKGGPDHQTVLITAIIYSIIFCSASFLMVQKRDV